VPCGRLSWLLVRFWAHVKIVDDDDDDDDTGLYDLDPTMFRVDVDLDVLKLYMCTKMKSVGWSVYKLRFWTWQTDTDIHSQTDFDAIVHGSIFSCLTYYVIGHKSHNTCSEHTQHQLLTWRGILLKFEHCCLKLMSACKVSTSPLRHEI